MRMNAFIIRWREKESLRMRDWNEKNVIVFDFMRM